LISSKRKSRGFTLIELITTVAVASTIAAISWHYFEGSKRRSQRSDAVIGLAKAKAFAEKCYSNYRDYSDSKCDLPASLMTSPKGLYAIDYSSRAADTYVLQATTQGAQVADNAECQIIGITDTGDTSNTAAGSTTDKCWPK